MTVERLQQQIRRLREECLSWPDVDTVTRYDEDALSVKYTDGAELWIEVSDPNE